MDVGEAARILDVAPQAPWDDVRRAYRLAIGIHHPYRDYSAPWFGERYVLRGASRATSPRMAHSRYRNYFTPERNDIHGGFRSCAR